MFLHPTPIGPLGLATVCISKRNVPDAREVMQVLARGLGGGMGISKKCHRGAAAFVERYALVFPELHPMATRMMTGPSVAVSDLMPAHQSNQAAIFFVARQGYVA
jgi:hypothetical protein